MVEVDVHDAMATLEDLIRRATAGEEFTIVSEGRPVARLIPAHRHERALGRDEGLFEVPEDFDAPLPENVLKDFGV